MGLYDHFTLVQQRTSLCVLNVVQLSTINDPDVDTDVSFIDPAECPHAGIYQWTSYYTVPDNMISDPSLHYVPDFRITFSTDNGNRIGCTITGPIALRMIAAQKERDGLIAFGIALGIFVSIFGILLLGSQYRRLAQRTGSNNNNVMLQQRLKPRPFGVNGSTTSTTTSPKQHPLSHHHHPYPYYNNTGSRSRTSTNSSSQYVRTTLSSGPVAPGMEAPPPPSMMMMMTRKQQQQRSPAIPRQLRRFQQQQLHSHDGGGRNEMTLSTSVEDVEDENDDDDDEYADQEDYIHTDDDDDDCYHRHMDAPSPPSGPLVRSNPPPNDNDETPSRRPII